MKKNSFINRSALYLINAIISAVLSFVLVKICGKFIEPAEYGIYNVIYGIYALLLQIVFMVFTQSILRFYDDYSCEGNTKFYQTIWLMLIVVFAVYLLIQIFLIPIVCLFVTNKVYKLLIFGFSIIFLVEGFHNTTLSLNRAQGKAKNELISSIVNHLVKIAFFVIYFFLISKTVLSIVVGSLCGFLVGIFIMRGSWKKPILKKENIDYDLIKKILLFGLPLIGVPIVNYLLSMSDQLIIKFLCGDYDTGLYSMGHKIATNLFSLVSTFLITAGHPVAMRKYDNESPAIAGAFVSNLSFVYFTICLPLLVEVVIFADYLILFFASDKYADSSFVLSVNSIGIVFAGYINYTNKPWEMTKKSWMITIFSLIGAIINIILNVTFIPIYGYKAAAVTTIFSYFTVILLSRIGSSKIISLKIGLIKIFKLLSCLLILFAFLFFANKYFVNDFYSFAITAFVSILIYALFIFLFLRKEFKLIINDFNTN